VNRERYAREVFRDFIVADAVGTIAQPWAHNDQLRSPEYDPEAALELLVAAGWFDSNGDGILENGAGVPFDLTVIVRDDARRELIQVLRSVKADWADLGVALRIQLLPAEEFQERAIRGYDYDLIAYAYDLYPGFTDFDLYGTAWDVRTNRQGWNPGGYSNPTADEAIAAYLNATDVAGQREALLRLQASVNDDLFGIWLGFPADLILSAIGIDGFQPNKLWQTADTRLLWRTERPESGT
jgi:peptide/nickel transport system substrate-binding protein